MIPLKKWTEQEIEYLKKWYCKKPTTQIAKYLDRTEDSIRRKADRLGITDASNKIRGEEWKEKEINYLKKWYNKKTIRELAATLNRSRSSIQNKANRLGLLDSDKRNDSRPWTEEEVEYLEKYFEKYSSNTMAFKLKRSINSVRRKAQSIGLNAYVCEDLHVKTLANCFSCDSRVVNRWLEHGLPYKSITKGKKTFKLISIKKFWKWAETNQEMIPWQKYERLSILPEPKWLNETIKNCENKNNRKPITPYEIHQVIRMKKLGKSNEEIAKELGRTVESVKHIWRNNK
jgi:DNA-binding CsgD family transcriptional regulator